MGSNVEEVTYYCCADQNFQELLAGLRNHTKIRAACYGDKIWLKNFSEEELNTPSFRKIPGARFFYEKDNKLVPYRKFLPEESVPDLLWSPLQSVLTISIPEIAGSSDQHVMQLVGLNPIKSNHYQDTSAILAKVKDLQAWANSAPAIRFRNLEWILLNADNALILGKIQAAIPGEGFYQRGNFLLPNGFKLSPEFLIPSWIHRNNPEGRYLILVHSTGEFSKIPYRLFRPLSKGSVTLTLANINLISPDYEKE